MPEILQSSISLGSDYDCLLEGKHSSDCLVNLHCKYLSALCFIEETDRVKEMGEDRSLKTWRGEEQPRGKLWDPFLGSLLKPTYSQGPETHTDMRIPHTTMRHILTLAAENYGS